MKRPRYPMPDFMRDALNGRGLMDCSLCLSP